MNTRFVPGSFARAALLGAALFASSLAVRAQHFTTYDLVVPVAPTNVTTTIDGTGRILPTDRSFVIALQGGTRGPIVLSNWNAANPNYPIVVVNQHGTGRVVISDQPDVIKHAFVVTACSFVQIRGDNDPAHYYGIKIARSGGSQRGLTIWGSSTNIEVCYLEIANSGFTGIMAKTDPVETNPATWAANYTMHDMHFHNNYIHDVGGEGFYIGFSSWSDDKWTSVPGHEGHEIKGLRVHHNLIERTELDGLQFSSAVDDPDRSDDDVLVHDNIIVNPAVANAAGQNAGIAIGGGSGGRVFNNLVFEGPNAGFALFGRGYNTIFNNLVVGGTTGVYTDNRGSTDPRRTIPGSFQSFYNNTFVNQTERTYWTRNEVTSNEFKNNIGILPGTNDHIYTQQTAEEPVMPTVSLAGNLLLRNTTGVNFVNPAERDYRINLPSSAANVGVSLASLPANHYTVVTDFQGIPRPQGAAYDAGFSEAGPLSVFLVTTPPTTGNTGSVKASVIGGTAPYTYSWSTGATTQTLANRPEGLYRVTVTDSTGAKVSAATYLANGASLGAPVRVPGPNEALPPAFSPAPGTFSMPQTVTLTTPTSGATIRYTLDGTTPTPTSGLVYSGAISVPNTAVITAIATAPGLAPSTIARGTFVIANGPTNTKFTGLVASASTHTGSNSVANTIDGNLATRWAASNDGAWVSYDFESNRRLGYFAIAWYRGPDRHYTFDFQVSTNGSTWTTVLANHQSPSMAGLQVYDIPDLDPVRYVRIVTHGHIQSSTTSTASSIEEVEFWGGPSGTATAPVITAHPQSQSVAAGANVVFSVTASGSPAPTYQWRKNGTAIPGATSSTYTITNVQTSHAGTYSVVVTNSAGSVTSNNATLAVGSSSLGVPLQAEDATAVGAQVRNNQTGYTGTGFVDYINATGDYIEWTLTNPSAATRSLTFRHAMTGSPRTLSLAVNGTVVNNAFAFTTTGGANIWALATTTASLPAGTVTIRLTATGTSGPNVDYLQVD